MKPEDYLKKCPGCTEEQMLSYQKRTYYTYTNCVFTLYAVFPCMFTYLLLYPKFLAKYKERKKIWQSIVNVYKKVMIHSPIGLFIV